MNFSQLNVPNFLKHLRNEIKRRRFFLLFWDKPYQETNFKSNLNSAPSCKLGKNTVRFAHVLLFHFISLFFLSGFSFTDTDDSQDSRGREGTIFYSTLPLPPAHEHSEIYLQLCMWDDYHIFLMAPLVFTRLLLDEIYHLNELLFDWLIDDVTFDFCLSIFWFDSRFLFQLLDTGNLWIRTRID